MSNRKIQIDMDTFTGLCRFFGLTDEDLSDDDRSELYDQLHAELRDKLESVVKREAYTRYKTAQSAQEREAGRQDFLDAAGVPDSYRWSREFEDNRKYSHRNK